MDVEIRFPHGLGDCVQLSVVLKHLRHYHPDWEIDVVTGVGKASALGSAPAGLCRDSLTHAQPRKYDKRIELGWWENYRRYPDRPNSKITNCLADVFRLDYRPELGRYEVAVCLESNLKAIRAFESIGAKANADDRFNVVLLHYQGNTSPEKKSFDHAYAREICDFVRSVGRIPVILDWDNRSPLPDGKTIHTFPVEHPVWNRIGTGEASILAAMIRLSEAFVGIDSGPGKIASATDTPNLSAWHGHHPLQFHDPSPSTVHLVPAHHATIPPLNGDARMTAFFEANYRHRHYHVNPQAVVCEWLAGVLKTEERVVTVEGFRVPPLDPQQALVIIEDVYKNDAYRTALRPKFEGVEYVVDVGANLGTFARLWRDRNPLAEIVCIEMHPALVPFCEMNAPFARVIQAACSYDREGMAMLDAVISGGTSIGGSRFIRMEDALGNSDRQYKLRTAPPTVTLEEASKDFPRIDVLKLDCEGSEFSILEHCDLSRIGTIFVESHDSIRWRQLLNRRFRGWDLGHMSANGNCETWHLVNPVNPRTRFPG